MIIKLKPDSDTYVTNLKVNTNDGSLSNLGQASTLDLFKIKSTNSKIKARAFLSINLSNMPSNGDKFILRQSTDLNTDQGTIFEFGNEQDKINIDPDINIQIQNIINFINNSNITITASKLDTNKILLTQNSSGVSGEKNNSIDTGIGLSINNFTLFEHSAILMSFPIKQFHNENVLNLVNSSFNISNIDDDSTKNFKANIVLKDVGFSNTKPKNFTAEIKALQNKFIEGLGRDTLYFSDQDETNFINIDSKNNISWANQDIVSADDVYTTTNFSSSAFDIVKGDENLTFDITNFIYDEFLKINNDNTLEIKENFVVCIPYDKLFNEFTYFVKRFGSNQIRNKYNSPLLEIKIKDDKIQYFNNKDKKRYLDSQEVFYLKNIVNNKLADFLTTVGDIKLKITYLNDNAEVINLTKNAEIVYDYVGKEIKGIKKFIISNSEISRTTNDSQFISDINSNRYVEIKFKYFYDKGDEDDLTEIIIKEETVKFYIPDTESEISTNNIRASINLQQQNLHANNTIEFLKVSFIDIERQYDSVKIPFNLASENMGDVYYEMYDVDNGEKLIEFIEEDKEYTKLYYNGDDYILNLFCSELYKNRRVGFTFIFNDSFAGKQKHINDLNQIIRFK